MKSQQEIRKYLNSLSEVEIKELNNKEIENSKKEYSEFKDAFNVGCCYMCGMKINHFDEDEECLHWLLFPDGLKKKHLKKFLVNLKKPVNFYGLQSYLRWVANSEHMFKNINDLNSNKPENKIIEETIKYKNIEWSINIGKTDFEGHLNTKNSDFPHYHLQILKDERIIVKFSDFHIPFSQFDLFTFKTLENDDLIEHLNFYGEGMSIIENERDAKWLNEMLISSDDIEKASFHTQSIIEFNEPVDALRIEEIKKEAKLKKIPIRKYILKYYPDAKVISKFNPGGGIIDKKNRNKTR